MLNNTLTNTDTPDVFNLKTNTDTSGVFNSNTAIASDKVLGLCPICFCFVPMKINGKIKNHSNKQNKKCKGIGKKYLKKSMHYEPSTL